MNRKILLKSSATSSGANLIYVDATERFLSKLENVSDRSRNVRSSAASLSRCSRKRRESWRGLISWVREPSIRILSRVERKRQRWWNPTIMSADFLRIWSLNWWNRSNSSSRMKCAHVVSSWDCRIIWYTASRSGTGLGVRCLGAITRDRLEAVRESDAILREEFEKPAWTRRSGSTLPWYRILNLSGWGIMREASSIWWSSAPSTPSMPWRPALKSGLGCALRWSRIGF